MPVVRLPHAGLVRFPDDMPDEEVRWYASQIIRQELDRELTSKMDLGGDDSFLEAMGSRAGSFAQSVANTGSSFLKTLADLDELTSRGMAYYESDAASGLSDVDARPDAALFESENRRVQETSPEEELAAIRSNPLYRMGQSIEDSMEEAAPTLPGTEGDFGSKMSAGLGSFASALIPGTAAFKALRAARLAAPAARSIAAAISTGALTPSEYQDAFEREISRQERTGEGVDVEKARAKASLYAGLSTAIERGLGVGRVIDPLDDFIVGKAARAVAEAGGKIGRRGVAARAVASQAISGGIEEGSQQAIQDLIVEGKINKGDVLESALIGSLLEGPFGGLTVQSQIDRKMAEIEGELDDEMSQPVDFESAYQPAMRRRRRDLLSEFEGRSRFYDPSQDVLDPDMGQADLSDPVDRTTALQTRPDPRLRERQLVDEWAANQLDPDSDIPVTPGRPTPRTRYIPYRNPEKRASQVSDIPIIDEEPILEDELPLLGTPEYAIQRRIRLRREEERRKNQEVGIPGYDPTFNERQARWRAPLEEASRKYREEVERERLDAIEAEERRIAEENRLKRLASLEEKERGKIAGQFDKQISEVQRKIAEVQNLPTTIASTDKDVQKRAAIIAANELGLSPVLATKQEAVKVRKQIESSQSEVKSIEAALERRAKKKSKPPAGSLDEYYSIRDATLSGSTEIDNQVGALLDESKTKAEEIAAAQAELEKLKSAKRPSTKKISAAQQAIKKAEAEAENIKRKVDELSAKQSAAAKKALRIDHPAAKLLRATVGERYITLTREQAEAALAARLQSSLESLSKLEDIFTRLIDRDPEVSTAAAKEIGLAYEYPKGRDFKKKIAARVKELEAEAKKIEGYKQQRLESFVFTPPPSVAEVVRTSPVIVETPEVAAVREAVWALEAHKENPTAMSREAASKAYTTIFGSSPNTRIARHRVEQIEQDIVNVRVKIAATQAAINNPKKKNRKTKLRGKLEDLTAEMDALSMKLDSENANLAKAIESDSAPSKYLSEGDFTAAIEVGRARLGSIRGKPAQHLDLHDSVERYERWRLSHERIMQAENRQLTRELAADQASPPVIEWIGSPEVNTAQVDLGVSRDLPLKKPKKGQKVVSELPDTTEWYMNTSVLPVFTFGPKVTLVTEMQWARVDGNQVLFVKTRDGRWREASDLITEGRSNISRNSKEEAAQAWAIRTRTRLREMTVQADRAKREDAGKRLSQKMLRAREVDSKIVRGTTKENLRNIRTSEWDKQHPFTERQQDALLESLQDPNRVTLSKIIEIQSTLDDTKSTRDIERESKTFISAELTPAQVDAAETISTGWPTDRASVRFSDFVTGLENMILEKAGKSLSSLAAKEDYVEYIYSRVYQHALNYYIKHGGRFYVKDASNDDLRKRYKQNRWDLKELPTHGFDAIQKIKDELSRALKSEEMKEHEAAARESLDNKLKVNNEGDTANVSSTVPQTAFAAPDVSSIRQDISAQLDSVISLALKNGRFNGAKFSDVPSVFRAVLGIAYNVATGRTPHYRMFQTDEAKELYDDVRLKAAFMSALQDAAAEIGLRDAADFRELWAVASNPGSPIAQRITEETVRGMFGGELPPNITLVHNPDATMGDSGAVWAGKTTFAQGRWSIEVNTAAISSPMEAERVVMEELIHAAFRVDPDVQSTLSELMDSITEGQASKVRSQGYSEHIAEEAAVKAAVDQWDSDRQRSLFRKLMDQLMDFIRRVTNQFGGREHVRHKEMLRSVAVRAMALKDAPYAPAHEVASLVEKLAGQINAVRKRVNDNPPYYRLPNGQLRAPNGQPSKLSEDHWALVRTPLFKQWFGDWQNSPETASQVVDENGEPLVVHHVTDAANSFEAFKAANRGAGEFGPGYYFTSEPQPGSMPSFLNIRNPAPNAGSAGDGIIRGGTMFVFHGGSAKGANGAGILGFNENVLYSTSSGSNSAMDSAYMDLVERYESGDRSVLPEIEKMVADAAVSAGYTRQLLHGTPNNEWTAFDLNKFGSTVDSGFLGRGIYLTDNPSTAQYHASIKGGNGRVVRLFVKLENPFTWGTKTLGARDSSGQAIPGSIRGDVLALATQRASAALESIKEDGWTSVGPSSEMVTEREMSRAITEVLINRGHDGVVSTVGGNAEVVVFAPTQIKSADPITRDGSGRIIPLSQRFSSESQDIRYAAANQVFTKASQLREQLSYPGIDSANKDLIQTVADAQASLLPDNVRARLGAISMSPANRIERRLSGLMDWMYQYDNLRRASGYTFTNVGSLPVDTVGLAARAVYETGQTIRGKRDVYVQKLGEARDLMTVLITEELPEAKKKEIVAVFAKGVSSEIMNRYTEYLENIAKINTGSVTDASRKAIELAQQNVASIKLTFPEAPRVALLKIAESVPDTALADETALVTFLSNQKAAGWPHYGGTPPMSDAVYDYLVAGDPANGIAPAFMAYPATMDNLRAARKYSNDRDALLAEIQKFRDFMNTFRAKEKTSPVDPREFAKQWAAWRNTQREAVQAVRMVETKIRQADDAIRLYTEAVGLVNDVINSAQFIEQEQEAARALDIKAKGMMVDGEYRSLIKLKISEGSVGFLNPADGKHVYFSIRPNVADVKANVDNAGPLLQAIDNFLMQPNVDPGLRNAYEMIKADLSQRYMATAGQAVLSPDRHNVSNIPGLIMGMPNAATTTVLDLFHSTFGGVKPRALLYRSLPGTLASQLQVYAGRADLAFNLIRKIENDPKTSPSAIMDAIMDAAMDHGMVPKKKLLGLIHLNYNDGLKRWDKEVLETIFASNQNPGQKPLRVGDVNRYGHKITAKDMKVAMMQKAYMNALRNGLQGDSSFIMRSDSLSTETERYFRNSVDFGLKMPRELDGWVWTFVDDWARAVWSDNLTGDNKERLKLINGPNFDHIVNGWWATTNPEYWERYERKNRIQKQVAMELSASGAMNFPDLDSFLDHFAERRTALINSEAGKAVTTEAQERVNALEILLGDIDQSARLSKNTMSDLETEAQGVGDAQGRLTTGRSTFTEPRGMQIAPDSWFNYSVTEAGRRLRMNANATLYFQKKELDYLDTVISSFESEIESMRKNVEEEMRKANATEARKRPIAMWKLDRKQRRGIRMGDNLATLGMLEHITGQLKSTRETLQNNIAQARLDEIDVLRGVRSAEEVLSGVKLLSAGGQVSNVISAIYMAPLMNSMVLGQGKWGVMASAAVLGSQSGRMLKHMARSVISMVVRKSPWMRDIYKTNPKAWGGVVENLIKAHVQYQADKAYLRQAGFVGTTPWREVWRKIVHRVKYPGTGGLVTEGPESAIRQFVSPLFSVVSGLGIVAGELTQRVDDWAQLSLRDFNESVLRDLKAPIIRAMDIRSRLPGWDMSPIRPFTAEELGLVGAKSIDFLRSTFMPIGVMENVLVDYYKRAKADQAAGNDPLLTPIIKDPQAHDAVIFEMGKFGAIQSDSGKPDIFKGKGWRSVPAKIAGRFMSYPIMLAYFNDMAYRPSQKDDDWGKELLRRMVATMVGFASMAALAIGGFFLRNSAQEFVTGNTPARFSPDVIYKDPSAENLFKTWAVGGGFLHLPFVGDRMADVVGNGISNFSFGDLSQAIPGVGTVNRAVQTVTKISQSGDFFYPMMDFVRMEVPASQIALNRVMSDDFSARQASRVLRAVAPEDMEVRSPYTGAIRQTTLTPLYRDMVNAAYSGDQEEFREIFNRAITEKMEVNRKLNERRGVVQSTDQLRKEATTQVRQAFSARNPMRTVFGRNITPSEMERLRQRMTGSQEEFFDLSQRAFDMMPEADGARYSPYRRRQSSRRRPSRPTRGRYNPYRR